MDALLLARAVEGLALVPREPRLVTLRAVAVFASRDDVGEAVGAASA